MKKSLALGHFLEFLQEKEKKCLLDFWLEAETFRMIAETKYKRTSSMRSRSLSMGKQIPETKKTPSNSFIVNSSDASLKNSQNPGIDHKTKIDIREVFLEDNWKIELEQCKSNLENGELTNEKDKVFDEVEDLPTPSFPPRKTTPIKSREEKMEEFKERSRSRSE